MQRSFIERQLGVILVVARPSGLANIRSRADERGGSDTITSPPTPAGRGTRVTWAVPQTID